MRRTVVLVFASLILMTVLRAAIAGAPLDQSIAIETTDTGYVVTVPVSRLAMTVPKGNLVLKTKAVGGSPNNPRYFLFQDPARGLVVSGWFEPASGFSGMEKF